MPEERIISVRLGIRSLCHWYSLFGVLAAAIACVNFVYGLTHFHLSDVVRHLLITYRLIAHGAIDWIASCVHIQLVSWIKDPLFLYFIVGGASVRTGRTINADWPSGTLKDATRALFTRKDSSGAKMLATRISAMYQVGPWWLRGCIDFFLWPRRMMQIMSKPIARLNLYTERVQFFPANYPSNKPFLYDRRVIFGVHLAVVFLGFLALLITNAFLSLPEPKTGDSHALQRTAPHVTAAASGLRLSASPAAAAACSAVLSLKSLSAANEEFHDVL